jgi:adenosine deaminase
VAEALENLSPARIAHGVRAIEDAGVVDELVRRGVALDVCIASNVATGVVPSVSAHPALRLLRAGVPITLSTDDPGLFGTTLRSEYRALASLGATPAELAKVERASLSRAIAQPAAARTASSWRTRS